MSKNILVVESDPSASGAMQAILAARGFFVEETTDAKGSLDTIRQRRPDLVVLAIELAAGQNGYIICGKLKKDDELKSIPVVLVGNPDGFAQHKKLKTRADDYVAKPISEQELISKIGVLIGLPEQPADMANESLSLNELLDEQPAVEASSDAEEIQIEDMDESPVRGDPELDMLDSALDGGAEETAHDGRALSAEPPSEEMSLPSATEEQFPYETSSHDSLEAPLEMNEEAAGVESLYNASPETVPSEELYASADFVAPGPTEPGHGSGEFNALHDQLEQSLNEANERAAAYEARVRELELELESARSEAEAARASGGRNDKEYFALREAGTKKDKEILRLKSELNDKDREIVDLQEKETSLEQQLSQFTGEAARKDSQLKSLNARLEQLEREREAGRSEAGSARQEAENARAELLGLQQELESARNQWAEQSSAYQDETSALRQRVSELEEAAAKNDDRVTKLYSRIKREEQLREKTKKALTIALQLVEEPVAADEDEASEDEATA